MNQTASTNKARLLIDHPHSYREWRILGESSVRRFYDFESISNRGLCGLLLNFRLLFVLHSRIPANEGLPELVIEHLRSDLQ